MFLMKYRIAKRILFKSIFIIFPTNHCFLSINQHSPVISIFFNHFTNQILKFFYICSAKKGAKF
ncbi:MAG: hypothetical protein A2W90_02645 [Bacteroidetes bacterium GWF2_42_66]|nr:MAG: hypothetical protein A2W92_19685 [Bacteroidetes bacterium GWA2_42_15]OFY01249.1 MAG: hypothetical protein A2W89_16130 [Bacteroidetes bacterium GWE2_42_39]OFY42092.1 MAG: hypothetical protein A2W90_02645 [Bacteroidetes bacterium GWF2_42_66]HBL77705.1 hypothetical protein [Prolixibacteraceae bacterium]HCB62834.1 hypothetical protein [Bacteroidales bacterium]